MGRRTASSPLPFPFALLPEPTEEEVDDGVAVLFWLTAPRSVKRVRILKMKPASAVGKRVTMKRNFNATVWQEGEWFIAQCLEVDVASQGATEAEALENLSDALELHFAPPVATLVPQVRQIEVEVAA